MRSRRHPLWTTQLLLACLAVSLLVSNAVGLHWHVAVASEPAAQHAEAERALANMATPHSADHQDVDRSVSGDQANPQASKLGVKLPTLSALLLVLPPVLAPRLTPVIWQPPHRQRMPGETAGSDAPPRLRAPPQR